MDLMSVDGLISPGERELLRELSAKAAEDFGSDVTIVNIGIFLGASVYCCRAGASEAKIVGVDINGWDMLRDEPEMREVLNMRLIQGDSRKAHDQFDEPIHMIFVDGEHSYETVKADIENWVIPYLVEGGYCAFHDARYPTTSAYYAMGIRVSKALEDTGVDQWEELPHVDATRVFRRVND